MLMSSIQRRWAPPGSHLSQTRTNSLMTCSRCLLTPRESTWQSTAPRESNSHGLPTRTTSTASPMRELQCEPPSPWSRSSLRPPSWTQLPFSNPLGPATAPQLRSCAPSASCSAIRSFAPAPFRSSRSRWSPISPPLWRAAPTCRSRASTWHSRLLMMSTRSQG